MTFFFFIPLRNLGNVPDGVAWRVCLSLAQGSLLSAEALANH